MRAFKTNIFFILLFLSVIGCEKIEKHKDEIKLSERLEKIETQARNFIEEQRPPVDKSIEEVNKLHQWEYRAVEISDSSSAEEIEGALQALGKERFECFSIVQVQGVGGRAGKLLATCKRAPETLLRYVPRSIIGR